MITIIVKYMFASRVVGLTSAFSEMCSPGPLSVSCALHIPKFGKVIRPHNDLHIRLQGLNKVVLTS